MKNITYLALFNESMDCPDLIESINWSAKTGGVMTENPAWFLNSTLFALLACGNIPSSALLCVYRADQET